METTTTTHLTIFNFNDPRDFLAEIFLEKKKKNPSFSIRAWAKQMNLEHHALLAAILSKKRSLRPSLAKSIKAHLALSPEAQQYFDHLVAFTNAEDSEEKEFYAHKMSLLAPRSSVILNFEILRLISEWEHTALLELIETADFNSDISWIAQRLGTTLPKAEQAFARLLHLGLIELIDGEYKKTNFNLKTPDDIPNKYIQEFHEAMIEKAKQAITKQSVHEREIRGLTLAISKNKLSEAKKLMRTFMSDFSKLMSTPENEVKDEVFQLNLQLFQLTTDNSDQKKVQH